LGEISLERVEGLIEEREEKGHDVIMHKSDRHNVAAVDTL
jgi:hypothetical protein